MGLFKNVTPEQHARRQAIIAAFLLVGIPILNAFLQKYAIPPIVLPASSNQPTASQPLQTNPQPAELGSKLHDCSFELGTPTAPGPITKARAAIRARMNERHGILKRIRERRMNRNSHDAPFPPARPACEVPV